MNPGAPWFILDISAPPDMVSVPTSEPEPERTRTWFLSRGAPWFILDVPDMVEPWFIPDVPGLVGSGSWSGWVRFLVWLGQVPGLVGSGSLVRERPGSSCPGAQPGSALVHPGSSAHPDMVSVPGAPWFIRYPLRLHPSGCWMETRWVYPGAQPIR